MGVSYSLKHQICSMFEVHEDENAVQRIVTPLEYPMTGDRIVVRVRSSEGRISVDENGDAALFASMSGGDVDSEASNRWIDELKLSGIVSFGEDEVLSASDVKSEMVVRTVFRVAEAAQQLFAIATSRLTRISSDFKARVADVVISTASSLNVPYQEDVELEMAGGMIADFVIDAAQPLIIIAASSLTRLLEAELIHSQYQIRNRPGFVIAVAESQNSVGKKQFERANYYTGKTVTFNPNDLRQLLTSQLH